MKKFISVALAVLMILSVLPVTAFAAGVTSTPAAGDKITTNVCSIWYMKDGVETKLGDYNNLDSAFEALKPLFVSVYDSVTTDGPDADTNLHNEYYEAAGSPVIKVNGNFNGAYARPNWCTDKGNAGWQGFYDPNKVPTVVIDGAKSATENYTITFGAGNMINTIAYYNLTVRNTNLVFANNGEDNSICWAGNDTGGMAQAPGETYTIFENCSITQNSTAGAATGSGGLFKLNGRAKSNSSNGYVDPCETDKFNLILKDTTINTFGGIGLQVHWGADANIEMHNSVWTHSGKAAGSDNNDAILKAYECGDINIYIDGTSKLVGAVTDGATTVTLIRMNDTARYPVTITLEKGAELSLQNNSNTLRHSTFIACGWWNSATVIDNGAVYKASAKDAALGVVLYPIGNEKVWSANGELTAQDTSIVTGATSDVIYTYAVPVDPAEGKVAYIEVNGVKTYYTTLKNALDALGALYDAVTTANLTDEALWQAAGSPVIYLYEDIVLGSETFPSWGTASGYNANRVRTVVIKGVKADGKNPVITSTVAGAAFGYLAYYNFTLEDIDLNCTQGFALFWRGYNGNTSAKSTTNLINCNIAATGTSGEGLVFKVTGNQNQTKTENYIINFVNTDIEAKAGVNAVFLLHHGSAGQINIDGNSSITHYMQKNAAGGDTMFMMGTNRQFEINVASGAKLEAYLKQGQNGSYKSYAIVRTEDSDTYHATSGAKNIINIADGAIISIDAAADYTMPIYVIQSNTKLAANGTVVNMGKVNLTVTAEAADNGFGFICGAQPLVNDGSVIGCYVNGGTALYQAVIPAGAVNVAITSVTPVFYTADDFAMVDGASLRTVYKENGIRFSTTISADLKNALGANAVYGTVIAPTNANPNAFEGDKLDIVATKYEEGEGVYTMHAAVIMPADVDAKTAYELELAANAYFTVTYADGTTATFNAAFNADENVRSMKTVAENLAEQGYSNRVVDRILEVCA